MSFRAREYVLIFVYMIQDGILGSVAKIEFANTLGITAMPDLLPDYSYVNFVRFSSGYGWTELYSALYASSLEIDLMLMASGQTLITRLPNTSQTNLALVHQLLNMACVLKITLGSGKVLLMGSVDFPVFVTAQNMVGAGAADANGYPLEFKTRSAQPIGFYTDTVEGALIYNDDYITYNDNILTYGTD